MAASQSARKPTKNQQRRLKKKVEKQERDQQLLVSIQNLSFESINRLTSTNASSASATEPARTDASKNAASDVGASDGDVKIPDANEEAASRGGGAGDDDDDTISVEALPEDDPLIQQFSSIFSKFEAAEVPNATTTEPEKPKVFNDDDDHIQDEEQEAETKKRLSKKARKTANKLSVAELKAIVSKPECVEWMDTDARDPKLLVNIKSARNVIPVPNHWSLKREYLSGKRGIEKPGFALPKFISETGISTMRDAVLEKQAEASLKQRQRERVQPKLGKLDIDYQKYYEAFFRRQTKPSLSRYGEVYYEGKEFETNLRHLRPGELSDELREALNMPIGAPPPWLINMQKVGLPPSYPALKIPGLNAPPPPGQSWGLQPGGYGKPPVDEQNNPLYGGDIFGLAVEDQTMQDDSQAKAEPVDKSLWGELQPFQDEEEEDEEEGEEEEDEDDMEEDQAESASNRRPDAETPYGGTETPGFASSVLTPFPGTQTMSEEFNIRKDDQRGTETEPRSAGTVLGQRQIRAEGFFGGERAYDLSGTSQARPSNVPVLDSDQNDRGRKRKVGDVDVSMDVDALERNDRMTKEEISRQYDTQRSQQGSSGWQGNADREDFSSMVAEDNAKRQKRDRERERDRDKRGKR